MKLLSADEREDLLVCPGRFSPSKGQDVLISALALLPPSAAQTRVEFLGSGPTLEGLRQQARQAGVADRCLFTGSVAHDEVLRRMSRARATIVPSRDEAFGLVNIESLSVGTPVIASNVGGIPEIIRDGVEGFLVPSGDSKVLAEKIARLLPDCGLRERLGLNARQRFLNEYEDAAVVRKQADWLEHSVSCDEVEGVRV
jgi:glycosyltransferase involved in cell wall biosynthesis